ncbi:MAG: hypothetical protein HY923_05830 [Elusimicrobia bacterium]|nr:hypothetical protein [Elusimicrobiota bacterium]
MRRGNHRHPVLEAAVFAAALLLAGFVGRELWRRRAPAPESAGFPVIEEHVAAIATPLPQSVSKPVKQTETSVTHVPSIRLTRVQRRKQKNVAVPVPK